MRQRSTLVDRCVGRLESLRMSVEALEFVLLLSGWIVAFLLGKELQTGFRLWRTRTAEQRARRDS